MTLVNTGTLSPKDVPFGSSETLQIYNALDCCLTLEIFDTLCREHPRLPQVYDFARALQAPALEMMLRGFKIDDYERRKGIASLEVTLKRLDAVLQRYAFAVWGKAVNPRSPVQLRAFFYDALHLPEQWTSIKGVRALRMNRESLEKLSIYFHALPVVNCILAVRDHAKQLEVLKTEVDQDGRMRTSYNIAGTETGRWSSSASSGGTGTNLQNISPRLRKMFIPDPGWKLCGIDLEQAESREVGFLCGTLFADWSYLDACEGGDLHTTTCRLIWPDLGWTGDAKEDRLIAERPFYREFSYRDMSKRGGHGSNYYGTPFTMARHLKVPTYIMEQFQKRYFAAFPCIQKWHRWTAEQLETTQQLVTPFGRRRHFFGRPNDDSTLREAIAFSPQSSTGDRLNLGLLHIWQNMPQVRLLAQVHDAVYFMYPADAHEPTLIKEALSQVEITTEAPCGRRFTVPGEAKIGWNWANEILPGNQRGLPPNAWGLTKFRGTRDSRVPPSPQDRIL